MASPILFTVLLQIYFYVCFAEWIEITKIPAQGAGNKSEVKPKSATSKYNNLTSSARTTDIHPESFYKRTFINKVFTDEQRMEEEMHKSTTDDENSFGFIPYIQNIQSTLIKNTHQTVKSKISLLQQLKYNLLFNIKEKINNLWAPPPKRQAREYYQKEEEQHVDFPSNEGALMTIGFLTFAVFLIKLVLKLIYALKNKNANGINPNATPIIIGRGKRDIFNEEAMKILRLIEEYKFA